MDLNKDENDIEVFEDFVEYYGLNDEDEIDEDEPKELKFD